MIARVLLVFAFFLASPALAVDFPPLSGRVVDQANLLSPAQEADLTARLEALQTATSRQLVVATVSSLQDLPIEDYGSQLGRAWGIGQRGANNGIILLIAPNERKMRIEVGYGLEGIMTDALSSRIIREQITPRFRADPPDYAGGINAGADAIIAQLQAPPEAQEQAAVAAQQAENQVKARSHRRADRGAPVGLIVLGLVFFFIIIPAFTAGFAGRRYKGRGRRGVSIWGPTSRRGGNDIGWMLAGMFLGSLGGGRGGGGGGSSWGGSSGGGSWGGGGGGGFSGGGGSFGGGGASGGW